MIWSWQTLGMGAYQYYDHLAIDMVPSNAGMSFSKRAHAHSFSGNGWLTTLSVGLCCTYCLYWSSRMPASERACASFVFYHLICERCNSNSKCWKNVAHSKFSRDDKGHPSLPITMCLFCLSLPAVDMRSRVWQDNRCSAWNVILHAWIDWYMYIVYVCVDRFLARVLRANTMYSTPLIHVFASFCVFIVQHPRLKLSEPLQWNLLNM